LVLHDQPETPEQVNDLTWPQSGDRDQPRASREALIGTTPKCFLVFIGPIDG
jgi:hypothetical protein